MDNFIYRNEARKRSTTVIVALVIAAIFAMWVIFDAHWVIIFPLVFCVLLIAVDWMRNPKYLFEITDNNISWTMGSQLISIPVASLKHAEVATRIDRSAVVTFHQTDGQRQRMHPACTPPQSVVMEQLKARDIDVVEKQFQFLA